MWFLQPNITFLDLLLRMGVILVITFFVLPLHEFAHAWIAYKLGDNTAKLQGRLTLNPLVHFSIVGAVCMLFFNFGWAKPVNIDSRNFKNPRKDMALVAFAGPVSQIVAALIGGLVLNFTPLISNSEIAIAFSMCISYYISINIFLAVYNLLPFPPLDGFKILQSFLPENLLIKYYQYLNTLTWIFLFLLFIGVFDLPINFLETILYTFIVKITHIPFII